MSKRVQVTLSEEEFEIVSELAELRGVSLSVVLGDLLTDEVRRWMRKEIRARQAHRRRETSSVEQLGAAIAKIVEAGPRG